MSGQQKRGFRLPWTAERGSDEASAAATLDGEPLDTTPDAVGDDLGDGPFPRAESEPAMTTDDAPAVSDVPDASAEAEMIDTDSMQDRIDRAMSDGAWPTSDAGAEVAQAEPAAATDAASENGVSGEDADAESTPAADAKGKRANPLVAGLVKAMREAAIASRAETTTRLQAEAASRIEAIRAESTDEAAALRKRVDEDIAGIRDWSKVEMARIRAETEHRIEERRADAINESQRHLDAVEQHVERVQATVTAFESNMDAFFKRLLSENDPARLAALAEQAPDAPDLTGELQKATGWTTQVEEPAGVEPETVDDAVATAMTTEQVAEAMTEAPATEPTVEAAAETAEAAVGQAEPDAVVDQVAEPVALEADAAAEAEVAATEGLDMESSREWPAAFMAAARRSEAPAPAPSEDDTTSKLHVTGLTSVAGISAFKGAIGGLPGVRSVSVSTGERGVFVYSVNHEQGTDLAAAISSLSTFAAEVTPSDDGSLSVTAHEPAA
jgi:hypothetical protein